MKKVWSMFLVVCLCCGMLAGCNKEQQGIGLPHNPEISLVDSAKDIIKKDELIELDKENPSYDYLTQIADSYTNAEEELGKQYVKDGDSSVLIDGYEFRVSYVLHEEEGLVMLRYRGNNIDSNGREELLEYLTDLYGEEIKNAEFALYEEYHQIKVKQGKKNFSIELGTLAIDPEETRIDIQQLNN